MTDVDTEQCNLTVECVRATYNDCLFRAGDDTLQLVEAEGVLNNGRLHKGRLATHRDQIVAMLAKLSDDFRHEIGGGQQFMFACLDRDGFGWTTDHQVVDQLIQLGVATGQVAYCIPRYFWDMLPHQQPFIVIM